MDQIGNPEENNLPIKYGNSVSDRNPDWVRNLLGVWIQIRNHKDSTRKQKEKVEKIEEISCFEELNVLFRGLKAPVSSLRHNFYYNN
jgi:hypothetical protein